MPLRNEIIRVGNSTGRVKNYYANGLIVIYDVEGSFESGQTVTCDDSGESFVLSNFSIEDKYDMYYDEWEFDLANSSIITLDDGAYVATDAHFTGAPSQDYQTTNLIVEDKNKQ